MTALDFHSQLKYLSETFEKDLVNSGLNPANSPIDSTTIEKITTLQEFLISNASQLDRSDVSTLLNLQISVNSLSDSGLASGNAEQLRLMEGEAVVRLRLLNKIMIASIVLISLDLNVNQFKLPEDLQKIRLISPPHMQAYVIAQVINRDSIAIKDLNLTKQQLKEMGPYLTYLDSQDAFDSWDGEEIESFLSTCSHLKILRINSPKIKHLPALPVCEVVDCSGCSQLEHLGGLPKCELFVCADCPLLKQNELVHKNVNFNIYSSTIKPKIEEACQQYGFPKDYLLKFLKIYGNIEQNFQINGIFNGRTALIKAINIGKPPLINALLALGADIHQCDERGATPFMWAIKKNNFELVKLWGNAAEINQRDQDGESPLFWAVKESEDPKMVELVYSLGDREVNTYNCQGLSPLLFAMFNKQPEIEKLLINLEADEEYAIEGCKRIFLAHIFGIGGPSTLKDKNGVSHTLRLEGCCSAYIMQKLSEYATSFFNSSDLVDESIISKESQLEILESLEQSYPLVSDDEILNRINLRKPCVILAGIEGHAISMVIYQGKLVVFNRGMGGKDNAAEIYELPNQITEDFITKLTTRYSSGTISSSAATFNEMITGLNLTYLGGFKQKDQKVGNCTWASAKGALGVLCRLVSLTGKRLYKIFTSFSRAKGLEDYVYTSKQIDWDLVERIRTKKAQKTKPFILKQNVEKQTLA